METRYPIRKADGTEYQHYREIVNLLGNSDGQWLVANNFPSRLRSMKRLWTIQRGLRLRREGEAKLIEGNLQGV